MTLWPSNALQGGRQVLRATTTGPQNALSFALGESHPQPVLGQGTSANIDHFRRPLDQLIWLLG